MAFILFVSMFAMDVFEEYTGWTLLVALFMHLIPSIILTIFLVLAWRWEWIGAVIYGVAGILYAVIAVPQGMIDATLMIGLPALLIGVMFLTGWLKRAELRAPRQG